MNPRIHALCVARESSGWGQASRDWLTALHAAGADLSFRCVLMGEPVTELPPLLAELEAKSPRGADVVWQHLPPHLMEPTDRVRTAGMFVYESSHFRQTGWARTLNRMDAVIVPCQWNRQACEASGVKSPLHVVPHAVNTERYCRSAPPLKALQPLKDEGLFLFYSLSEWHVRKNLSSLALAFYLEFDTSEPVGLVLKVGKRGVPPEHLRAEVADSLDQVRAGSGLRKRFRRETILTERLTDAGVLALHQGCDVFVQTSYGESFSYPAFDAMAMGKCPIVPDWGGYREYVTAETGYPVPCRPAQAYGMATPWGTMTADEEVGSVSIPALRKAMRASYENKDEREGKAANGVVRAFDFGHDRVGEQLLAAVSAPP
jgi:glycosyltransferase involved in cell wall biosynthesis